MSRACRRRASPPAPSTSPATATPASTRTWNCPPSRCDEAEWRRDHLPPFAAAIAGRHPHGDDGAHQVPGAGPVGTGDAEPAHPGRPAARRTGLRRRGDHRRAGDGGDRGDVRRGGRRRRWRSPPAPTCSASARATGRRRTGGAGARSSPRSGPARCRRPGSRRRPRGSTRCTRGFRGRAGRRARAGAAGGRRLRDCGAGRRSPAACVRSPAPPVLVELRNEPNLAVGAARWNLADPLAAVGLAPVRDRPGRRRGRETISTPRSPAPAGIRWWWSAGTCRGTPGSGGCWPAVRAGRAGRGPGGPRAAAPG